MKTTTDNQFTAYLLDPALATVKPVVIDNEKALADFYNLIGCNLVTVIELDEKNDIFIDDEGLLDATPELWAINDEKFKGSLFAGRGVLVARNDEGEAIAPTLSIDEFADRLLVFKAGIYPEFTNAVNYSEELGLNIISAKVGNFRLGLQKNSFTVVREVQ